MGREVGVRDPAQKNPILPTLFPATLPIYLPAGPGPRSPGPRLPRFPPAPPCPGPARGARGWQQSGSRASRRIPQSLRFAPPPPSSHLVDSLITGILQGQVHHGVLQRPAHVELQRQVVDPLPDRQMARGRASVLPTSTQLGPAGPTPLTPSAPLQVIQHPSSVTSIPALSPFSFSASQALGPTGKILVPAFPLTLDKSLFFSEPVSLSGKRG